MRDHDTSMLFITRDIGITAHFCDRVAVIYRGEIVEIAETASFFDNPQHPYSVMLLAAFAHNPALRNKWHKPLASTEAVAGRACQYAPRCVHREDECDERHPDLRELGARHLVRCHFPVERVA